MAKERILIVEDEYLVAHDISHMLRDLGYEVAGVASTAEEAMEAVRRKAPDMVLLDIVLKGAVDGITVAELINNESPVPIIFLTAHADEMTLSRAKYTDPYGYLLKPFDERELQTTIEMAFFKFQMDKKLLEREEWLSTVLRSIGDGVIAADGEGRVTFLNLLAEQLTGSTQAEALGKPLDGFFRNVLEPGADGLAEIRNAEENALMTKDGGLIPIEETVSPIFGGKKERLGNVFIFRDIRSRKKSEREIRESWLRLQKALAGTVQAMGLTIEMRDPYTAGHQRRVSKLSCLIAEEMGLDATRVEGVRMAGDIHDIGKIYVPAEILSKPGQLSQIEFSIIRTHSQVGYDILKNIEFPWPIARIIYEHHERQDGSGYPNKLRGEEILLESRIIAVADVVEAMSSHRPYRPSHGVDKALDEIERHRGGLYDSDVVDACLRLFKEKMFVFE